MARRCSPIVGTSEREGGQRRPGLGMGSLEGLGRDSRGLGHRGLLGGQGLTLGHMGC